MFSIKSSSSTAGRIKPLPVIEDPCELEGPLEEISHASFVFFSAKMTENFEEFDGLQQKAQCLLI
jgi:hypothetical protein